MQARKQFQLHAMLSHDHDAYLEDAGGKFRGKAVNDLMKFKPGNYARNFFKKLALPLATRIAIKGFLGGLDSSMAG